MFGTIDRSTSRARYGLRALAALTAAGTLAMSGAPAQAVVNATLSFVTPTGIVGPTDAVQIYARLTLAGDSDALATDSSGRIISGIDDADWTVAGIDPAQISYTFLNVFLQCGGNFLTACTGGPAYEFDVPIAYYLRDFSLQAGQSFEFLYGTFTPTGGVAAPGDYSWYNMGIYAGALDENGNAFQTAGPDPREITINVAQSCPGQESSCAFTRTVVETAAVPEPASWALMIGGFALAGAAMRRRRATVSFA